MYGEILICWRPQKVSNFDELQSGELYVKLAVATCNLVTISAFVKRHSETKKTCVDMAGQNLSDIY
jgi:hypothetical protein